MGSGPFDRRHAPARAALAVALALGALALVARPAPSPPGLGRALAAGSADAAAASPAGPDSGEPDLAVAPDGTAFLSWLERVDRRRWALRVARAAGGRWEPAGTVAAGDSFFVNGADFPRLLALDPRRLVAAWPWLRPGGRSAYEVRVAISNDGGRTWSAPRVPHDDLSATEHGFVSLAPERGGTRIVWLDGRAFAGRDETSGADMALHTAWLGPDGTPGPDRMLDPRVCDCCQTAAAATARGTVVAFRDRSPTEVRDTGVLRQQGDGWRASDGVPREGWTIHGCPVNGPALAADGERVALAWYAAPGDSARASVCFSADAGTSFGPPVRVDDGAPLGHLAVALLEDGSAAVAWLERDRAGASLRLRRVAPDGRRGPARVVARLLGARGAGVPRVALGGGRLLVAWTDGAAPARVRVTMSGIGALGR